MGIHVEIQVCRGNDRHRKECFLVLLESLFKKLLTNITQSNSFKPVTT